METKSKEFLMKISITNMVGTLEEPVNKIIKKHPVETKLGSLYKRTVLLDNKESIERPNFGKGK